MNRSLSWLAPRRWSLAQQRGAFRLVLVLVVAVAVMPPTILGGASIAQASSALADRPLTPKRAPGPLRAAQLAAIDAAFAKTLATDGTIDRHELKVWLNYHGRSLTNLLAATGLDPARLVMSAIDDEEGKGGPFVAVVSVGTGTAAPAIDTERLVEEVLSTVPVVSPVRHPHRVTSRFGPRRDPFHGRRAFHRGIDLAAPRGTPIHSTAAGQVVRVGRAGGYGNLVEIDHGNGLVTRYAHLHAYFVRRGDWVERGETVGLMGRTGRSTGVHLHYEVVLDGDQVDPAPFLAAGRSLAASRS